MSLAEKFSSADWETLQFAPFWAFSQVAGIDGKIDDEEVGAFIHELAEAPIYKSPLVRDILMSVGMDAGHIMAAYQQDTRTVTVGLAQVADVLDANVEHDEGVMFKGAVVGIAISIAKASGPRWGNKVSKEEEMAVNYVGNLLRLDPSEFNRIAPSYHAS